MSPEELQTIHEQVNNSDAFDSETWIQPLDVEKLLDYIDELENAPLVKTVVEQKQEIEQLHDAIDEAQKHVDSRLDYVNGELKKINERLAHESKEWRAKRLSKIKKALCGEKGSLGRIKSILSKMKGVELSREDYTAAFDAQKLQRNP